jgi:hypothetical protein
MQDEVGVVVASDVPVIADVKRLNSRDTTEVRRVGVEETDVTIADTCPILLVFHFHLHLGDLFRSPSSVSGALTPRLILNLERNYSLSRSS